jgi:hypothetical protein
MNLLEWRIDMPVYFHALTELLGVVAWPLVVLIALWLLRPALGGLAESLSRHVKKVSFFDIEVELSTLPEFKPPPLITDIRELNRGPGMTSQPDNLFAQIAERSASDYVIIDLGSPETPRWLTSRLYIFALMLGRMRGLQCFVFVETAAGVRKKFVGTATPGEVRWALTWRYPWLETTYAAAYGQLGSFAIDSIKGAIREPHATLLVQNFLESPSLKVSAASGLDASEWLETSTGAWEHAKWVDSARLDRVMDLALSSASVKASPDAPRDDLTRAILRRSGRFVALVDDAGVFQSLVDRAAVLEQLAATATVQDSLA